MQDCLKKKNFPAFKMKRIMKKYMIIAAAMLTALACTKAEMAEKAESPAKEGVTIFSAKLAPATKISIGEKVGSAYKALWEAGDVLDVIKTADGSSLGTATLTDGVGEASGTFELPAAIANGTEVRLVYGSDGVATDQTQAGAGASSFQAYAYAKSAAITVDNGVASAATLSHETAVVKVSVSAGAALQGATVSKLILRCIGGTLSGTDKDYVQVSLTTPLTLSATAQDIWAIAAPYNATGKEIDVALVITKGGETYTLPIGFTGKAIEANKVSSFPLSGITDSDCVAWYAPHDARLMPGPGYGYGEANCYLIQYKGGTYNGATLSPDSNIPASVNVDFRARGDFLKVDKPENVTFEWVKKIGTSTVYNIQTSGYTECNVNSFSIGTPSNYSVTITNTGAFAGAPILSMKKGGKVLWAWTLWNVSADGTRFGSTDITGTSYKLANMDIGQNTTDFVTWASNKNGSNPDVNYRTTLYYQWGRPTPIFWSSWPTNNFFTDSNYAISLVEGQLSIEDNIAYPGMMILNNAKEATSGTAATAIKKWSNEVDADLWGNPWPLNAAEDQTKVGQKTIYDPCPEGWRVPDPAVYNALSGTTSGNTTTAGAYYSYSSLTSSDNYFTPSGRYSDFIANNGRIATEGMPSAGNGTKGWRWTNSGANSTGVQARAYQNHAASQSDNKTVTLNKAFALAVRCIRDE